MQRRFTYHGVVRGQGRPRANTIYVHNKKGERVPRTNVYKDDTDRDYEHMIAWAYQFANPGAVPFDGAFVVNIKAVVEPPQSAPMKRKTLMLNGTILPTVKPDIDNICKSVLDALNGLAYVDDKNCIGINACKVYGDEERIEVILTEAEEHNEM